MNWAGITLIVIYALSLGVNLQQHGQPKEGKHSFWVALVSTGIVMFLIYMAGGFS